jgi:hypothetical protein
VIVGWRATIEGLANAMPVALPPLQSPLLLPLLGRWQQQSRHQ